MEYEYDICDEFDCTPEYCKMKMNVDCKGKFHEESCMFYGEHKELNKPTHFTKNKEVKDEI